MSLSSELEARGFIHQHTAESLSDILDGPPRVVYHGFDPSADSIHAGNFVQWILLRHLVLAGHKVVLLVGGGTGMIGDPKPNAERALVSQKEIDSRVRKMEQQAKQLFGGVKIDMVNNYHWLKDVKLLDFLRDIGKLFTVNELIKKDAIATRLASENGLSYTEFAYPLLQGYDYLMLYRKKNCTLQTGGSDQWGNMVAGVDLIRRLENAEAHVVTTPIIVDKTTGKKFGKSEGNAIWLSPEKTSPYHFYQFWLNVADENVVDYLKLFTFLSLEEIDKLEQKMQTDPGARITQHTLANEVTTLVHGEKVTAAVTKTTEVLFGTTVLTDLPKEDLKVLERHAPLCEVLINDKIINVLVKSGLASSKREARTFIEGGAITLNSEKIVAVEDTIGSHVTSPNLVLLQRGKKQRALLQVRK